MTPVTLAAELIRHSAAPEKRTGCHPSQHRAATHLYGRFSHADVAGRAVWSAAMSTIDAGGSERLPLARQARCNTRPAEPHLAGRAVDVISLWTRRRRRTLPRAVTMQPASPSRADRRSGSPPACSRTSIVRQPSRTNCGRCTARAVRPIPQLVPGSCLHSADQALRAPRRLSPPLQKS
jgi:hypothetical protein